MLSWFRNLFNPTPVNKYIEQLEERCIKLEDKLDSYFSKKGQYVFKVREESHCWPNSVKLSRRRVIASLFSNLDEYTTELLNNINDPQNHEYYSEIIRKSVSNRNTYSTESLSAMIEISVYCLDSWDVYDICSFDLRINKDNEVILHWEYAEHDKILKSRAKKFKKVFENIYQEKVEQIIDALNNKIE